jgi:hypothetical protein
MRIGVISNLTTKTAGLDIEPERIADWKRALPEMNRRFHCNLRRMREDPWLRWARHKVDAFSRMDAIERGRRFTRSPRQWRVAHDWDAALRLAWARFRQRQNGRNARKDPWRRVIELRAKALGDREIATLGRTQE